MNRDLRRPERGVSLVEALVALAVMAFGMLAYVGLQTTLRLNGDVAKDRSEAVRIAQQAVERWRGFTTLEPLPDEVAYADIDDALPETVVGAATGTTFTLQRSVETPADQPMKTLRVDVSWTDRAGDTQSVRLSTTIAGVAPALAATLGVPGSGSPYRMPRGRHPAIPLDAVAAPGGLSRFTPPQPPGGTVSWLFDNASGLITHVCDPWPVCTATDALLLAGYVRFALAGAPTPADAEVPRSASLPVAVVVQRSDRDPAETVGCHQQQRSTDVRYFCAIPISGDTPATRKWSGRAQVLGLPLASSVADASDDKFRVCRYTKLRSHATVPAIANVDHPLDYVDVRGPLANQNYLVILAGDGASAFDCPDDDAATALVDGRTWHHQPPS